MYIFKVKGKAKIPHYIQIRDSNFVLIEYFRADRTFTKLNKYGWEDKEKEFKNLVDTLPFGKLKKIEL